MKSGASKYALATEKQQFFSFPFPIRSSKGEISRQIPYLPLFCQLYLPRITFATTSLLMHLLCTTKTDTGLFSVAARWNQCGSLRHYCSGAGSCHEQEYGARPSSGFERPEGRLSLRGAYTQEKLVKQN